MHTSNSNSDMENGDDEMECSICRECGVVNSVMVRAVIYNTFGRLSSPVPTCHPHRMELSTLIVWDYDDTCYLDEDGMVLGVECSICHSLTRSFRDDGMLLACDNCYDEFKMEDSMYHSNIDDMEEDLANAKEEEMEDSMSEMENDLEYCGRMSARCYYCWLEMEHSNRQHGESETEYSKFSSWPSMPEME